MTQRKTIHKKILDRLFNEAMDQTRLQVNVIFDPKELKIIKFKTKYNNRIKKLI